MINSISNRSEIDEIAYKLFIIKYPNKKNVIHISYFMISHYNYNLQNEFYNEAEIELRKLKLQRINGNN